jgi:hypothetical protein
MYHFDESTDGPILYANNGVFFMFGIDAKIPLTGPILSQLPRSISEARRPAFAVDVRCLKRLARIFNTANVSPSIALLVEIARTGSFRRLPLLLEAEPIGIIFWPKGS